MQTKQKKIRGGKGNQVACDNVWPEQKKKKLQQKTEKPKFKTQNQSKNPLLFFCCYCSCCSFLFVACSVERFFSFPFFPLCVNGKGRDKYFPSHDLPVSVSLIICGGRNERTNEQHNTTQQSGWQFGVSAMYHEL